MEQQHNTTPTPKSESFFKIVKGLFFLFLTLQIAPLVFSNFKTTLEDLLNPKVSVGMLTISGLLTDSSFYTKKIEQFSKDADIKGIILKINSPGGLPGTGQSIFNEIKKAKKSKPVVVVVENLCASAAYNVAAASNKIICTPSALIGSIGVLMELPNVKELLNSWKIKFNYIQSGTYKTAGSPLRDTSQEELDYFQNLSDDAYKQFIKDVAESRRIPEEESDKWANGKVFTGNQALKLKLVDKLGSFQDGISELKKLMNIEEQMEIKLIKPRTAGGLARLFYSDDEYGVDTETNVSDAVASFAHKTYNKFLLYQKQTPPTLS